MTTTAIPSWVLAVSEAVQALPEVTEVHYVPPRKFLPEVYVTGKGRGLHAKASAAVHAVTGKPFAWAWYSGTTPPSDPRAVLVWKRGV